MRLFTLFALLFIATSSFAQTPTPNPQQMRTITGVVEDLHPEERSQIDIELRQLKASGRTDAATKARISELEKRAKELDDESKKAMPQQQPQQAAPSQPKLHLDEDKSSMALTWAFIIIGGGALALGAGWVIQNWERINTPKNSPPANYQTNNTVNSSRIQEESMNRGQYKDSLGIRQVKLPEKPEPQPRRQDSGDSLVDKANEIIESLRYSPRPPRRDDDE